MSKFNTFFTVDFNIQKLILLFNTEESIKKSIDEVIYLISELNEYQFLYFLNSINTSLLENDAIVELMISFSIDKPFYPDFHKDKTSLHGGKLKYKKTNLNELIDNTDLIKSIVELIQFDDLLQKKNLSLIDQIIPKLFKLQNSKKQLCSFEIDFSGKDENGFPHYMGNTAAYQQDRYTNKLELLINELLFFNFEYIAVTNRDYDEQVLNISKIIRKLYFNYSDKEIDYTIQLIYPLVFGIDYWEKLINKKIIECKNEKESKSLKDFFIQSLEQLKKILNSNYIPLKYNPKNKSSKNNKSIINEDYASINN